jgi:hypothetical protein
MAESDSKCVWGNGTGFGDLFFEERAGRVSGSGGGEMRDASSFYQAQGQDDLKQTTATPEEQATARAKYGDPSLRSRMTT